MHTHEKSVIGKIREEIDHWCRRDWSFAEVGAHWDNTDHYDEINEETYSYFRRFVDGFKMSEDLLPAKARVLDFCSRTGNGTLYFWERGKVGHSVCADVSAAQEAVCRKRLTGGGCTDFTWQKVDGYVLPFRDEEFDTVLFLETLEHIARPAWLVAELSRVLKPAGIMILTTPNVLWEPIHAFAAITGLHHSEGPHRFVPMKKIYKTLKDAHFSVERVATTVLIPFGPRWLTRAGEWIEARTKNTIMPLLGLRRILICRKQNAEAL